ncbi:helix-turn-helix domain-containing protein [Natribaculum luteum]|uniref:Helix-turn-helix domain-containing protein n=1 Tax=Natribaculum luteum TaxID=1586232 RepID=A0ABD5NY84_9EURY|nr:helix-turn-helix domain-containing protein [Natribaculum luteum]
MASGIHVQLEVRGASTCPVSSISEDFEIESLTFGQRTPSEEEVVGELTVANADVAVESPLADEVFTDESRSIYRYTHDNGDCPCVRVPEHGCPVRDLHAKQGRLVLSFITPDIDTLQTVITDLRSRAAGVTICRLTRSGLDDGDQSLLFVDRNEFTDRQYEVLETAHRMGYFESPKRATAEDVADELGISASTFVEHLSVAQTKLLDQVLEA